MGKTHVYKYLYTLFFPHLSPLPDEVRWWKILSKSKDANNIVKHRGGIKTKQNTRDRNFQSKTGTKLQEQTTLIQRNAGQTKHKGQAAQRITRSQVKAETKTNWGHTYYLDWCFYGISLRLLSVQRAFCYKFHIYNIYLPLLWSTLSKICCENMQMRQSNHWPSN